MKTKADCIFCKIVAGTAPSAKVYEDDHTLAFMDLMPVSRGHTLVIPKAHSENLFEIEAPLLAAVADVIPPPRPCDSSGLRTRRPAYFPTQRRRRGANSLSLPHALVAEVRRPRRPLSRARHGRRGRTRSRRHGDPGRTGQPLENRGAFSSLAQPRALCPRRLLIAIQHRLITAVAIARWEEGSGAGSFTGLQAGYQSLPGVFGVRFV